MNEEDGLSVLLVEDEPVTRGKISEILLREGIRVLQESNGAEGLKAFRQHRPDIVITDIRMPVMNGLEMTDVIKKIDPEVFVIVTTAHSDTEFLLTAIELGVDQYILKPIDLNKLLGAISKCGQLLSLKKEVMRQDRQQKKLIEELRTALAEIKTLRGIIPICASCKKIRDDGGYWQQVEEYIRARSQAEFSHSICPDCAKKLYPDYFKK
jgi:YesN/AraC family two-component response regulator